MSRSPAAVFEAARHRVVTRYAFAVVVVLLVTLLKMRVDWIGRGAPGAVYLGAVAVAAWFGGFGPGLVATRLSFGLGAYLFAAPHHSFAVVSGEEMARLFAASAEGALIALFAGALRRSSDDLHGEMRDRAVAEDALLKANEQLIHAHRMRAVGEFASGVAHDFNNMASVALVCIELLEQKLPSDHPGRRELAEIRGAVERAAALARELTTFARRRATNRTSVDVHEMLGRVEPILARVLGPTVKMEMKLGATRTRVLADVSHFEQAMVNLASNGRDAMLEGGVIAIETADASDASCRAHAQRSGPHVELVVRDSGKGMDAETKAHAFEPFFTTKPAGAGTGLGLSMVFGIVEEMGGGIAVESAPGRGTTFRLVLPVASDESQ